MDADNAANSLIVKPILVLRVINNTYTREVLIKPIMPYPSLDKDQCLFRHKYTI